MKGAQDERYADALMDQRKDDRAEEQRLRIQLEILGERVLEILNRKWAAGEQDAPARDYMAIRQAARSMGLIREPSRPAGSAPAPYPATYSDEQVAELRAADLTMRSALDRGPGDYYGRKDNERRAALARGDQAAADRASYVGD